MFSVAGVGAASMGGATATAATGASRTTGWLSHPAITRGAASKILNMLENASDISDAIRPANRPRSATNRVHPYSLRGAASRAGSLRRHNSQASATNWKVPRMVNAAVYAAAG